MALARDWRLDRAVRMEVEYWSHLDRLRLKVYEARGRAYALAVMKDPGLKDAPLREQHERRLELAEQLLPKHPLREHGVERLMEEARKATLAGLDPALAEWLPEVGLHFSSLVV